MILSDREILAAMNCGAVKITPTPPLEIWNAGPLRVQLTKGLAICQLIFEEVHGTPNKGYEGHFSLQGPDVSAEEN